MEKILKSLETALAFHKKVKRKAESEAMRDALADIKPNILKDLFNNVPIAEMIHYTASKISAGAEEEKTSSTAFIVGSTQKVENVLPSLKLHPPLPTITINDSEEILSLSRLVDGSRYIFLVSEDGTIHSIRKMMIADSKSKDPFSIFCKITRETNSIVIVAWGTKENPIQVFRNGELIFEEVYVEKLRERRMRDFNELLIDAQQLLQKKDISRDLFARFLGIAAEMSHLKCGVTFLIGDYKSLKGISHPRFKVKEVSLEFEYNINELSDGGIFQLASQDGATIVDKQDRTILFARTLPMTNKGEVRICDGERHRSASDTTAEIKDCVAVVVSQNMLITLFCDGKPIIEF